jgi:hypothetical protein
MNCVGESFHFSHIFTITAMSSISGSVLTLQGALGYASETVNWLSQTTGLTDLCPFVDNLMQSVNDRYKIRSVILHWS